MFIRPLTEGKNEFVAPNFQCSIVASSHPNKQTDGSTIAFQVIDLRTGEAIRAVSKPDSNEQFQMNSWTRLVVSANLKMAIVGNIVWDTERAESKVVFGNENIRAAVISPCGQMAIVATNEPNLRVWDIHTGELVRILEGMDNEVHDLSLSADGKIVAVATHWGYMALWDTADGEPILRFNDGPHVHSVALTPDARFAACGGDSGSVYVLDLAKGVALRQFTDQSRDFFAVAITPDGRIVAAQDRSYLRVWDVKTGQMLRKITLSAVPHRVKLSSDGALAVAGSHILDLRQGELPMGEAGQQAIPNSVAISDDGSKVLIGNSDGGAVLQGFGGSNPVIKFDRPETSPPESEHADRIHLLSPAINRDGLVALLAYTDGLLYLADLVTGQLRRINSPDFVRRLVLDELPKMEVDAARIRGENRLPDEVKEIICRPVHTHYGINLAILTPDTRYIVTSRDGEAIRAWDANSGECVNVLPIPFPHSFREGEVQCIVPLPDSEGVVFVTQDGRIHVWRFLGSSERFILPRKEYNTSPQICISADGKRVVFGGWFEPIEVWDILERRLVKKFDQKPDAMVHRLAISRDDAHLVVALGGEALNNEIVIWDMEAGTPICAYPVSSYPAHLSKVSEDGRFVCITDNGEVHFLSLENMRR